MMIFLICDWATLRDERKIWGYPGIRETIRPSGIRTRTVSDLLIGLLFQVSGSETMPSATAHPDLANSTRSKQLRLSLSLAWWLTKRNALAWYFLEAFVLHVTYENKQADHFRISLGWNSSNRFWTESNQILFIMDLGLNAIVNQFSLIVELFGSKVNRKFWLITLIQCYVVISIS